MVLGHEEIVPFSNLENSVAVRGRRAGARGVVQKSLSKKHARPMKLGCSIERIEIAAVGEPGDRYEAQTVRFELRGQHKVTRVIYENDVCRRQQRGCD